MKREQQKKAFLEHLRKVPIIQIACEKAGVSRATIYRWRDKEKAFQKELEEALAEGEALINDMSESQLISLIKEKSFHAVSFWLRHRHQKFRDRVEVTANIQSAPDELTPEQEATVREALRLSSINQVTTQVYEPQRNDNSGIDGSDDPGSKGQDRDH